MWRPLLLNVLVITSVLAAMVVSTQAAFTAQATISGINFSTGHAALNLFGNLGYTNAGNNGNLTYILPGRSFNEIGPFWSTDYLLKYFNNGSVKLMTELRAVIQSDPANLAEQIMVETWLWEDVDGNGSESPGDNLTLIGSAQSLESLVTSPVALGQLNPGNPRGLRLRFMTDDLPPETQLQTLQLNFVIGGTTEGVTP